MDKNEALKRAEEFAKDLQGIIGQLPMERVVVRHVGYFKDLRADGVTWPQISELMKSVGVRRKDGKPVPPEQWRAMVSRSGTIRPDSPTIEAPTKPLPTRQASIQLPPSNQKPNQNNSGESDIRQKMRRATSARQMTGKPNE